jgi:Fic family protein
MKKADNFDVHKWNNIQKKANIINESNPQSKEYTVDDFILQNADKKYYQTFFDAIFKDKSQEPDWDKITSMSADELKNTYNLSIEDATAIKDEFDKKIKQFKEKKLNEDENDSLVNKKVKNFLNNEIFNLEEMNNFNMREKMLKDVSNTVEEEIGEFVRKKFREERYTRRF